jgi:hypothetical protein
MRQLLAQIGSFQKLSCHNELLVGRRLRPLRRKSGNCGNRKK